jgi:hypothetical protein
MLNSTRFLRQQGFRAMPRGQQDRKIGGLIALEDARSLESEPRRQGGNAEITLASRRTGS